MNESIKQKIVKLVSDQIDYVGMNTFIDSKISSIVLPEDLLKVKIIDKEDKHAIPKIITQITGTGNPIKLFVYAGYSIRKIEKQLHNPDYPKNKKTSIFNKLNLSEKYQQEEDIIKNIANFLDHSETFGFGKNIKPFLFNNENDLFNIIKEIINKTKALYNLYSFLINHDEKAEEIIMRNLTYGYCLRVAFEIFKY